MEKEGRKNLGEFLIKQNTASFFIAALNTGKISNEI